MIKYNSVENFSGKALIFSKYAIQKYANTRHTREKPKPQKPIF
jgi:hypothetical protein